MIEDRLDSYFYEANRHKEHILEAKAELNIPIKDYDNLPKLEKFALNTLIFRFAKLKEHILEAKAQLSTAWLSLNRECMPPITISIYPR